MAGKIQYKKCPKCGTPAPFDNANINDTGVGCGFCTVRNIPPYEPLETITTNATRPDIVDSRSNPII